MKTRLISVIAIALFSLLIDFIPVSIVKADSVVHFPDRALEVAVRYTIGKSSGDIHQSDLLNYDQSKGPLQGSNRGIVDLTGLEQWTNLQWAVLDHNSISNLSPLSGLQQLIVLRLDYNKIIHIAGIPPNVQNVWLGFNQISDVSALQGLSSLHVVDLEATQVSDIEPLVKNLAIGYDDWVDVNGCPLSSKSIETWIPELQARGVNVEWGASIITGSVEDGYKNALGGVKVTLLGQSTGETITDNNGKYSFADIGPGDYQLIVTLECHQVVGDTATFLIDYDAKTTVSAQTSVFKVPAGSVTRDISFADRSLIPAAGIPGDRLDDLALIYYNIKQVVDFDRSELGVTLDLSLPIRVHGYTTDNPTTKDDESKTAYYDGNGGDIYIGVDRSDRNTHTKPWTPDWHEMFHELMDDTVVIPPLPTGDVSHGGYENFYTSDSWVEGWAEFWPCALARSLKVEDWYLFWGRTSLEQNWMVWDREGKYSREEFAVASLLVDLVDPVNSSEYDYIIMTNSELWKIIGSTQLQNMYQVYVALKAAKVGLTDTNVDGISDLDELFISHGFFADKGNQAYDGEAVGWGGKPDRPSTLLIPNAYLKLAVTNAAGNPVDSIMTFDVVFPSPKDIYSYSYEVDLHGSDGLVYLEVAPDNVNASIHIRAKDSNGTLSEDFIVSNTEYWKAVGNSTKGYAVVHTFVIGGNQPVSTTTATTVTTTPTISPTTTLGTTSTAVTTTISLTLGTTLLTTPTIPITTTLTPKATTQTETGASSSSLTIIIVSVVVLIIAVVLVMVMRRRKK